MGVRFGYLPVASVLADDPATVERIVGPYGPLLEDAGGTRLGSIEEAGELPVAFFVVTGGTEGIVLGAVEQLRSRGVVDPVLLIAHPSNNSLPASLETLARLQRDGSAGRVVYLGGPADDAGRRTLAEAAEGVAVARVLAGARVGRVGEPSDWLVASMPDAQTVRSSWGPELVDVPIARLFDAVAATPDAAALAEADRLRTGARACVEPTEHDLLEAGRVVAALRGIVREDDLDALTVRCFDLVLRSRTTGCAALAALIDEGVIAGCEGDVPSTIAMLWAQHLVGATPWMANPARVDEQGQEIVLAHCTVPLSIVESYRLRSHFESGLGVGIQGAMPLGPVTLVRIGGAMLERAWIAEGEIVATGEAEDLCRTQVTVRVDDGDLGELLRAPLGNHLVVVRGRHATRFRAWHDMVRPGAGAA